MSSMASIILAFMLMIGGNPGYINSPPEVTESAIANPTDFELFIDCPLSFRLILEPQGKNVYILRVRVVD